MSVDHSHHHHHHHMDHSMMNHSSTDALLHGAPATTVATLLSTVMTSMMARNAHHHGPSEAQHVGHSMDYSEMSTNLSSEPHVHSTLIGAEGHMPMYFHFGVEAIILFKEWTTSTTGGLVGSVFGIFLLAMLYEGLKFFREYLFKKYFTSLEYSSVSVLGDDGKPVTEVHKVARNRMFSWPHMVQTSLHVVQMVLSYFLMLIFMTFNVWLCLGVIAGSGLGYFLFGWRKATVVDITEHCH